MDPSGDRQTGCLGLLALALVLVVVVVLGAEGALVGEDAVVQQLPRHRERLMATTRPACTITTPSVQPARPPVSVAVLLLCGCSSPCPAPHWP